MRLILAIPGNEHFADSVARACRWELGRLETRRFPDEESYVRLASDVAGRPVDLVCTAAGLRMEVRLGDEVTAGQPLVMVHAESPGKLAYAFDYAARNLDIIEIEP